MLSPTNSKLVDSVDDQTHSDALRLLRSIVDNVRHGRMGAALDEQLGKAEALLARAGGNS